MALVKGRKYKVWRSYMGYMTTTYEGYSQGLHRFKACHVPNSYNFSPKELETNLTEDKIRGYRFWWI